MVRVIDDIAAVHNYQEDHGGWNDDMALVKHAYAHVLCTCIITTKGSNI